MRSKLSWETRQAISIKKKKPQSACMKFFMKLIFLCVQYIGPQGSELNITAQVESWHMYSHSEGMYDCNRTFSRVAIIFKLDDRFWPPKEELRFLFAHFFSLSVFFEAGCIAPILEFLMWLVSCLCFRHLVMANLQARKQTIDLLLIRFSVFPLNMANHLRISLLAQSCGALAVIRGIAYIQLQSDHESSKSVGLGKSSIRSIILLTVSFEYGSREQCSSKQFMLICFQIHF
jgi:hypothetical protein